MCIKSIHVYWAPAICQIPCEVLEVWRYSHWSTGISSVVEEMVHWTSDYYTPIRAWAKMPGSSGGTEGAFKSEQVISKDESHELGIVFQTLRWGGTKAQRQKVACCRQGITSNLVWLEQKMGMFRGTGVKHRGKNSNNNNNFNGEKNFWGKRRGIG